jgi:tyrosinase
MDRYVSPELRVPVMAGQPRPARVDLELHDVDHSGPSYSVRVFLDDPDAGASTPMDARGYAGSFYVFGHGPCLGDEGHCDVHAPLHPFDFRDASPLTPQYHVLPITDALQPLMDEPERLFTVTLVAVVNRAGEYVGEDVLHFARLKLLAYQ